jgi:hypothetical protein
MKIARPKAERVLHFVQGEQEGKNGVDFRAAA